MTTKNEVVNVDTETGEIVESANAVIRENDKFVVMQNSEGKFVRRAKYHDYSSFTAETREDKLWLLNVLDNDEDTGNGLSSNVGKTIEVQDVITRSYDRINEDNGEQEFGVLTYLITPEREVFVTSSKSVYFTLDRIMDLFGRPDEDDWENIKVKVGSEKMKNGTSIKIKMVG